MEMKTFRYPVIVIQLYHPAPSLWEKLATMNGPWPTLENIIHIANHKQI